MNLLRAQLSDYELLLLLYNWQSGHGKYFIQYVERYALMDNLPKERLLKQEHADLLQPSAYLEVPKVGLT
jgi:hypothetical protein